LPNSQVRGGRDNEGKGNAFQQSGSYHPSPSIDVLPDLLIPITLVPSPQTPSLEAPPLGSLPTSMLDLLKLSEPANLPSEMRPPWLPLEGWERLRDLGKIYPYNKALSELFKTEVSCMSMLRYYLAVVEVRGIWPQVSGSEQMREWHAPLRMKQ